MSTSIYTVRPSCTYRYTGHPSFLSRLSCSLLFLLSLSDAYSIGELHWQTRTLLVAGVSAARLNMVSQGGLLLYCTGRRRNWAGRLPYHFFCTGMVRGRFAVVWPWLRSHKGHFLSPSRSSRWARRLQSSGEIFTFFFSPGFRIGHNAFKWKNFLLFLVIVSF